MLSRIFSYYNMENVTLRTSISSNKIDFIPSLSFGLWLTRVNIVP